MATLGHVGKYSVGMMQAGGRGTYDSKGFSVCHGPLHCPGRMFVSTYHTYRVQNKIRTMKGNTSNGSDCTW